MEGSAPSEEDTLPGTSLLKTIQDTAWQYVRMEVRRSIRLNKLYVILVALLSWYFEFIPTGNHSPQSIQSNYNNLEKFKTTVQHIHGAVEDLTNLYGLANKYKKYLGIEVTHFEEWFHNYRRAEKAFSSNTIAVVTGEASKTKLDDLEQNFSSSGFGSETFRKTLFTKFQRVFESVHLLEIVSTSIESQKSTADVVKCKTMDVLKKYNFISPSIATILQQYLNSKGTGILNEVTWKAVNDFADALLVKGRPEVASFLRTHVTDLQPESKKEVNVHVSLGDLLINQEERENLTLWRQEQKYNASSQIIKMISRIPMNDSLGWKLFSYLQNDPRNYDVTFAVGPKKIVVKAPKLILISSSVVFERDFASYSAQKIFVEKEEIPLPDLDPDAFKLFVELMILDTWSVDALMALELPSKQLLHLLSICKMYGMAAALNNLTKLATDFSRDFGNHVKPEDFFLLPQSQLETILASKELPMSEFQVYNYAFSWAEEQCKVKSLEVTGENVRLILGGCLYQIRCPLMSTTEFGTVIRLNGLLTVDEITEVIQTIGMDQKDGKSVDINPRKFTMEKRSIHQITPIPDGICGLSFTEHFAVTDTPFVCDGSLKSNVFKVSNRISLRGVGFLGPTKTDSFYQVTVQVKKNTNGNWVDYSDKIAKNIFAKKSKTFYLIFTQPIILDQISNDWKNCYAFWFSLIGPNTTSLEGTGNGYSRTSYYNRGYFEIVWGAAQLAEVLFSYS